MVQCSQLEMWTGVRGAVDDRDEIRQREVVRHLLLARHAHDGTVIALGIEQHPGWHFRFNRRDELATDRQIGMVVIDACGKVGRVDGDRGDPWPDRLQRGGYRFAIDSGLVRDNDLDI